MRSVSDLVGRFFLFASFWGSSLSPVGARLGWAHSLPTREVNVHFRGMATLPVDFGPQILAVRTRLGSLAEGRFRLSNLTGMPLEFRSRFVTRPGLAATAFVPAEGFPVTHLRPHESRIVPIRFRVRTDLDGHTPEIYVEYTLEAVR